MNKPRQHSLIIVGSPFQLLCALEAVFHFEIKDYVLIVRTSKSRNGEQILALLEQFGIKDYIEIERTGPTTFWKYVKVFYRLKKLRFDRAFIGENGNAFRSLCFSLKPREIYLVDDGVATIEERDYIEFPSFSYLLRSRLLKLKTYRYFFVGMTLKPPARMAYFTMVLDTPVNGEVIIRHKLSRVIEFYRDKVKPAYAPRWDQAVVFIDTPLVQARFLTEADSIWLYEKASNLFRPPDRKIDYFPHRSQNLEQVKKVLKTDSFEIRSNDKPIELEFILRGVPKVIIGTVSTALISMKRMFPNASVFAIDITEKALVANLLYDYEKIALKNLYLQFEKCGITIV